MTDETIPAGQTADEPTSPQDSLFSGGAKRGGWIITVRGHLRVVPGRKRTEMVI